MKKKRVSFFCEHELCNCVNKFFFQYFVHKLMIKLNLRILNFVLYLYDVHSQMSAIEEKASHVQIQI